MFALSLTIWLLLAPFAQSTNVGTDKGWHEGGGGTGDPGIVIVSTLDGRLRALDVLTGKQRWEMQEDPVLRAPNTVSQGFTFLPNPQDGSLYSLKEGVLRKLPFNIQQVVASSPCRGNDGTFYAGAKKDLWFSIDPYTGQKVETLSLSSAATTCPANDHNTVHNHGVFIGRTEYSIRIFDPANRTRSWNSTFVDYSAYLQPADSQYPLRHVVSSSTGDVLAINTQTGQLVWQADVGQPVVAMYHLQYNGLHRVAFTPVGREAMESIVEVRIDGSRVEEMKLCTVSISLDNI